MIKKVLIIVVLPILVLSACAKNDEDAPDEDSPSEMAQQLGDVMASIDESSGASSGSFAFINGNAKILARLDPPGLGEKFHDLLFPNAVAARCAVSTGFGACDNAGHITRTFNDCTIGLGTFSGTVELDFNANDCRITADGAMVDRAPNFQVTGRLGATLSVSKVGTFGQKITHITGEDFTFQNDGIRRVFTAGGKPILDFTTRTTSLVFLTGSVRNGRMMDGGVLEVSNNLTGVSCNFSPQAIIWDFTCNCPGSGSFTGSCSDSKTISLQITGCGTATLTVDGAAEAVTFDRCYSL